MSVHPRACGERVVDVSPKQDEYGSSPRLRGTLRYGCEVHSGHRFIPAPAGNAGSGNRRIGRSAVHPRACGERRSHKRTKEHLHGSSPRLRGTPLRTVSFQGTQRFIPAPAGNALELWVVCGQRPVHPRACGERTRRRPLSRRRRGSSPRLRGTRSDGPLSCRRVRFIPAPAGNAAAIVPPRSSAAVHPRACGERIRVIPSGVVHDGSSPRLRGTRTGTEVAGGFDRFIPAPAGNANGHHQGTRSQSGSSPRLRGTHARRRSTG